MVLDYLNYIFTFIGSFVSTMSSWNIVPGVSFYSFVVCVSLMCLFMGYLLLR